MIAPEVEILLNEQIVAEMYSAHLYLSISAWLSARSLDGYAHWYYVQYQEEMQRALTVYHFMRSAGSPVKLGAIEAPPSDFESLEAVLNQAREHEEFMTAFIYAIIEEAQDAHDFKVVQFLDRFVKEQVQEEENAAANIGRLQNFGADASGLCALDQQMGQRVCA